MCGIAGLITFSNADGPHDPAATQRAAIQCSAALAHRGPDGEGRWQHPTNGSILIHRRLAIIDLNGGRQPMTNENGQVVVIFNGEIYNHMQLRRQLQGLGHSFASDHSDTEVLVHGWEAWGEELPQKLLGMFAFAVYDRQTETLFLARDRMGQKPLYVSLTGGAAIFASELPAILTLLAAKPSASLRTIGRYLQLGYLPPSESIYQGIEALPPASWLRVSPDGVKRSVYWPTATANHAATGAAFGDPHEPATDAHAPAAIRTLMTSAVQSQLMSDVPLACFFSGGIDSSIVAALLQQQRTALGQDRLQTLCAVFDEPQFDEAPFARAVAKHIGTRHLELNISARRQVASLLHQLMRQSLGQPFGDSSILPTALIAQAARGIAPVALSGDGADELFGGYDRYRGLALVQRFGHLLRPLLPLLPDGGRDARNRLKRACSQRQIGRQYAGFTQIFSDDDIAKLGINAPPLPSSMTDDQLAGQSALRWAMACDRRLYLPGDVLYKVDTASMAYGLEVRAPFLDHRVAEFAASLQDTRLFGGNRGKLLLRQAFGHMLPPEIMQRKKHGFGLPIGQWFRGPLRGDLADRLTDSKAFARRYLRAAAVDELLRQHITGEHDHTHRLFTLLMLEIWYAEFSPTIADV
ncbi:MAG: asparagine synthase (glutamine-hydrolyzing) [Phycisphaerales bacterium]|nr:asparagine synthase (glutamine-hydrolyzing) [Phycisphaerales bacterium]